MTRKRELRMPDAMAEAVDRRAKRDGMSAAQVHRLALCKYLGLPEELAAAKTGRPSLDEQVERAAAKNGKRKR